MGNVLGADLVPARVERAQGRHLHGHIFRHLFQLVADHVGRHVHQHADLAAHVGVGRDEARVLRHFLVSADVHVLADDRNLAGQCLRHGLCPIRQPFFRQECLHVGCLGGHRLGGDFADKLLEHLVLCHKVGLRVDFHDNRALAVVGHQHLAKPLRRNAARLFLCGGKSFFPQKLYCLIHVAVRGRQGLFAVHHAGAGHFPKFFYHSRCDCHMPYSSVCAAASCAYAASS